MHRFFTTLRFRLILLVFLALLPALGLILYSGLEQRRIAVNEAKKDVRELVLHASTYQEQVVEGTRQLLFTLSELPMVQRQDGPACTALFARILEKQRFYTNISAINLQGLPFASARPQPPRSQLGRSHFERALQTRDFAIGEFGIGRTSGKPTLHFGYPIIVNGVVQGVVSASVDLNYLNTLVAKTHMPPGSSLTAIDRDGTILARHPHPEQWVGKRMAEAEIIKIILAKGEGITEAVGLQGSICLFAFTPMGAGSRDLFVYAGFPLKTIYAEAHRMLIRNLAGLGVAAFLALVLAWWLGQLFLINRTRTLVTASHQLAGGDLEVRSSLSYEDGEFGQLARSFDDMAAALQERQERLKESEEKYRTLVEQLPAITFMISLDEARRLLYVSPQIEPLLGISPRELLADADLWKNLIHPDDRKKVFARLNQIYATGEPGREEFRMLAASGALFWVRAEAALVCDQAGRGQLIQGVLLDITDRKRADEALRESESRYRTLAENVDLGITLIGPDHKIIMTNAAMGKIFQKSPEKFVGKYCFQEFEKRNAICPHCPAVKAMASGQPAEVDTIGVLDDGTFRYAHVRAFPTFDSLGNSTGFVEVVEDTTARRQAEEALAASEAKYRALIETTHTGFVIIDPQGKVLDANAEYLRLTGYNGLEEILGRSVEEWTAPADLQRNVAAVQECAETGYISNLEIAYVQKNGETIPIEINATSIQDASGNKIMSLVRDITQRKQMVEAIEESEQRFRDITENAVEWIWETDREGKYTFASPVVEKLLGYKPEEVLGQHFYDFFLPKEREALKDAALAAFGAKQPFLDFINRNLRKNGEIVWLSTSGVPILDDSGDLLGYRGADIDITERRQAQEALENANIQLHALVQEAEERNSTAALLNDMSETLQTCQTSEEAFAAINHFVPKFFPHDAGALYLQRNSKNLLSSVTTWGDAPPSEELFPPDDCWAVRSGRLHWVDDPASALLCKHMTAPDLRAMGYLCVPLMAQGESRGILHIRFRSCATPRREAEELAVKQRLAVAISENLALSLANLKLRETLQNQAIRDPLTGLYNRRYLEETMEREIHRSRRLKAPMGMVMMDLDHFKAFNDAFGHGAGDALLTALAHAITTGIRLEDIACRYGGEEFLLVLPGASLATTRERAENVRQAVKALQVKYQGRFLKSTTISLGVAIFPDHGHTAEEVISAADAALYRAKQAGRDRVELAALSSPAAAAP